MLWLTISLGQWKYIQVCVSSFPAYLGYGSDPKHFVKKSGHNTVKILKKKKKKDKIL